MHQILRPWRTSNSECILGHSSSPGHETKVRRREDKGACTGNCHGGSPMRGLFWFISSCERMGVESSQGDQRRMNHRLSVAPRTNMCLGQFTASHIKGRLASTYGSTRLTCGLLSRPLTQSLTQSSPPWARNYYHHHLSTGGGMRIVPNV